MKNPSDCSCPQDDQDKYRREHSPSLDNLIFTRRQFLERTGMGMGALSLASILNTDLRAADASLGPESCGFPDTLQLNCP